MNIAFNIRIIALATLFLLAGCNDQQSALQTQAPPKHLEAAKAKAMQLCAGCHGPQGIGTAPFNPNLACQKKEYMVKQLQYYRNGSRTTHQPMSNIARLLTEEEVASVSEWYSITGCL
ncbi:c-type cytochrome [Endozoicomonas elysicola]|uniref:c-type cytochrome n=1 Tax=Endozoicomonas elysicola TaxID=305900 RepID=UPI000365EBA0|nr:c-type cytochrome [Endozoicomonas elysicola]